MPEKPVIVPPTIPPEYVRVWGHPRSGNNFLMALMAQNFYGCQWFQFWSSHRLSKKLGVANKHVYIYRNANDVMRSIFSLRKGGVDFETFLKIPYRNTRWQGKRVRLFRYHEEPEQAYTGRTKMRMLKDVAETPPEYHRKHIECFSDWVLKNPALLMVSYDALQGDEFQNEMLRLALFLQSPNRVFSKVKEKVGFVLCEGAS